MHNIILTFKVYSFHCNQRHYKTNSLKLEIASDLTLLVILAQGPYLIGQPCSGTIPYWSTLLRDHTLLVNLAKGPYLIGQPCLGTIPYWSTLLRDHTQTNGIRYSVHRHKIWYIDFHSRNLHSFEPKSHHNIGSKLCRFREWKCFESKDWISYTISLYLRLPFNLR